MTRSEADHGRQMARARWDRTTPEQRAAQARDRFLTASVNSIEKRADELTEEQVMRILSALAKPTEAGNEP